MELRTERILIIAITSLLSYTLGDPTLSVDVTPSNYGTTETLKCTDVTYTSGNGYFWEKDGVTVFNNAGEVTPTGKYSAIINGNTFQLVINNINVSDEGTYSCNHNFVYSNMLVLEVESQGTATAKLSSSDQVEVTFKQIYPETISAVITCDLNTVAGSFVSSVAVGDRYTTTWQSTNAFSTLPSSCSASVTLRTPFSASITFETATTTTEEPPEKSTEAIVGYSACGVAVVVVPGGFGVRWYFLFSGTVWFAVLTYNGIWILGVSIGVCVIKRVTPGGPADGKLKVGNQIHQIDGVSLTGKDQHEIEAMIKDKIKLILHVSKVGSLEISIVELNCKKGELLGFDCENLAMVTEVTEGGKAYKKLKKGDRILSINGKSTAGKSIGDINKQLKIPPKVLELSLKREQEERNATLDFKGNALSGIAIQKEKEDIVVSAIELESAAAAGDVKKKDIILSVNGVSTAGMKVADIKEMLTFSIILKVTEDVTLKELDLDHYGSFGFETYPPSTSTSVAYKKQTTVTSVTPDSQANVVKSVTSNGPAARHGIKPGDKIVSINGNGTKGKSHQEIKAMLEIFGTSISLKIEEGIPCGTSGHEKEDALTYENETDHVEVPDSTRTLPPIKNVDEKNHLLGNPLEPIPRKN